MIHLALTMITNGWKFICEHLFTTIYMSSNNVNLLTVDKNNVVISGIDQVIDVLKSVVHN